MSNTLPVVIAGAGPTGCVLALYLAKRSIPVVLLEKERELPVDLRASTFHPISLDLIASLDQGVITQMLERGLKVHRYQYRDRQTGEVASFNMELIADETSYPFRLQLEQYELTRIIVEELGNYDCASVLFNHDVIDYMNHEDRVNVRVNAGGIDKIIESRFVVSAEGARSKLRKFANIGYLGFTYDEKFLVVSTDFPFENVFDDFSWVNYVADPDEWCVVLRTDKRWRVLFPTTPENRDDEALLLSDSFIQERLQHLYKRDEDYLVFHRSLYAVNQRVAETYYKERLALVGDACHINNPLGGMGMNGGLHDAFCLGEKLERICLDSKDHELEFARYDRQRKDIAVRFVQQHTIENKKLMESTDPDVQKNRQRMLMEAASDPVAARNFLLERAMINVYRESQAAA